MKLEGQHEALKVLLMDIATQAAKDAKETRSLERRRDLLGLCSSALSLMGRSGDIPF